MFEKSLLCSICLPDLAQFMRHGNITRLCHQLLVIKKRELRIVVNLPSDELFLNLNVLENSEKLHGKCGKHPL